MSIIAVLFGIVVGLIVAVLLWKPLFGDVDGFLMCLKYWLTPDGLSAYRGELSEDWTSTFRLLLWVGCTGGGAYAAYYALMRLFS